MKQYWTGSHTKHRLQYHLVWLPKYRKRVLKGRVAARLKQLFFEACQQNRWFIRELSMPDNHVHLLIQIRPKESISEVVQILKGGSSRIIRKEFPELEEFLWGDSFWADGYFAETVGQVDEAIVKKYIKEQHSPVS